MNFYENILLNLQLKTTKLFSSVVVFAFNFFLNLLKVEAED